MLYQWLLKGKMTIIIISIDTGKKIYDKLQVLLQWKYYEAGMECLPTCCNYYTCSHTVMVSAVK